MAGGGSPFAVRFETPPGQQAQVDFAQFRVRFTSAPDHVQIVWLFSMVLGFSRLIWGRFAQRQTMQTVLACHRAAFEAIGGVPREILYDRMKTAVLGEDEDGRVVYNRTLGEFARHYGFLPKACRAYRPETKEKVERPFRYIREDFFLGGTFRDLDDLNLQFGNWLSGVANPRVHATTGRVVNEAFAEEKPTLQVLPLIPFGAVLKLERRISHEGMVSVGGNYYSVPDATRRRVTGYDFSFQPSLDKARILALAELNFVERCEVVHLLGPPGTGKSHLASALGLEAVKAGKSVSFITLADLVGALAKAEREGTLRERIRFYCRSSLLIVDEIGYLPVIPGGGNLFFQLVNARYEKGAMILTSNRGFAEWGEIFGSPVVATALLDRLLHHAIVIQIDGSSYRLRRHADLLPEHIRSTARITPPAPAELRRRGRPPKNGGAPMPSS